VWQVNFTTAGGTNPVDMAALDHNATGKVWSRMPNTDNGSLTALPTSEGVTTHGINFSFTGSLGGNWGNPVSHVGYGSYNYNGGSDVTCQFINLPAGTYDVLVYGHGAANAQAGRYKVLVGATDHGFKETAQTSAAWNPPLPPFIENTHYVRWHSLPLSAGQVLTVQITNPSTGGSGYRLINMLQLRRT
jgi:hypothetical protein